MFSLLLLRLPQLHSHCYFYFCSIMHRITTAFFVLRWLTLVLVFSLYVTVLLLLYRAGLAFDEARPAR